MLTRRFRTAVNWFLRWWYNVDRGYTGDKYSVLSPRTGLIFGIEVVLKPERSLLITSLAFTTRGNVFI